MAHTIDETTNDDPYGPIGGASSRLGRYDADASPDEFTEFKWISRQNERRE